MNAAALAVAALLGLLVLGVHLVDRHLRDRGGSRQRKAQGARWANKRDLRALQLDSPAPGRLILGRHGRRLIATDKRASVVVVGPSTISLKTSGFAIPAVLEWEGPVVAASVKSDLLKTTIERRRSLGKTMVYDPAGVTGHKSVQASPVAACGTWRGAMRVAHRLAASARAAGAGGLEEADFWYSAAEKLIAPLLFAAASSGGGMAAVIDWLNEGPEAEEAVSECLKETGSKEARSAWRANWNREERQRSSIYTTAETILGAYADPHLQGKSSPGQYTPADLLDGGSNTLYLCAPAHEQERLRSVFAAMLSELVALVYERSAQSGEPIDPPLLIVLDEAANIAPMPDLEVVASTGAGQGIQLVTVFQDFAQVSAVYGKHANSIINNHRAKVFASGTADPDTLTYINRVVGEGEFHQRSETAGDQGRRTATVSSDYRDLAAANVVRGAQPGSALLVYGHLPPAWVALRPWFEDRALRELAEGSSDGN
ncbi:MAG: type IV secretory system conjugative DNA transfer family protein [Solirubrobacterales bacterium]